MDPVVGIDLGTTNSVVALVEAGRVRVLGDRDGRILQPSVVSFHPSGKILVGQPAKERRVIDPASTVFSIKRLIGRDVDSDEVVQAKQRFPFELVEGPNRSIVVRSRSQTYTLPEISAIVLKHMRGLGEGALGQPIRRAVITVPANFNDVQRSSTKVAGRIAGLEVLRILNEPTAAALAYGYGRGRNERIAIYDFGGGTFDVTILQLRDHVFEVLSTAGDTFLGGDDIDLRLADQLAAAFLRLHRVDLKDDRLASERLRAAAEQIKIELSTREPVEANIEELAHDAGGKALDLEVNIGRKDLEACIGDLVDRTFEVCDEAIRLAGISATELDNVILVGGTTRIPAIRARVAQYFGRAPLSEINPEEVVAVGAAIQGFALAAESARERRAPAPAPMTGEEVTRIAKAPEPPPARMPPPAPLPGETTQSDPSGAFDMSDDPFGELAPLQSEPTVRKPSPLSPDSAVGPPPRPPPAARTERLPSELGLVPKTAAPKPPPAPARPPPPPPKMPAPPPMAQKPPPAPKRPADDLLPVPKVAPPPVLADPMALMPKAPARPRTGTLVGTAADLELTVARRPPAPVEPPPSTEPRILVRTPDSGIPAVTPPGAPPPGAGTAAKQPPRRRDPTLQGISEMPPSAVVPPAALRPFGTLPSTVAPPPQAVPPAPPAPTPRAPPPPAEPDLFDLEEPAVTAAPVEFLGSAEPSVAAPPPPPPPRVEPAAPPPPPPRVEPVPPPRAAPAMPPRPQAAAAFSPAPAAQPRPAPVQQAVRPPPKKPVLIDVTPQTLSVQTVQDNCESVIERNSTIPIEQTRNFSTSHDDQVGVLIRICQGESKRASENVILGEVTLEGLRPAPRGEVTIAVTFEIDPDGILQVSARDVETGRAQITRITLFGGMSEDAVQAAMKRAIL